MDASLYMRFKATERRERGAAHRVQIEPSLDDPCTALYIIDRAPRPRAADGKLSDVS
jgi:predicted secreted protein